MRKEILSIKQTLSFNSFPTLVLLFYSFYTEIIFLFRKRERKGVELMNLFFVDIEPYRKKTKMVSFTLLALNDKKRLNCPES